MRLGLIFIADDLDGSEDGAETVALSLSDVMPVRFYFVEEDVEVGDLCWHVLSVEELGHGTHAMTKAIHATTQGRFVQTQFRLLNLSSGTHWDMMGVALVDRPRSGGTVISASDLEFID